MLIAVDELAVTPCDGFTIYIGKSEVSTALYYIHDVRYASSSTTQSETNRGHTGKESIRGLR
jgi:hypothetical protein